MTKDLSEGIVLDLNIETLEDYSGNSFSFSNSGSTLVTDELNRLNKARSFNGSTDHVLGDDVDLSGSFTITFMYKQLSWGVNDFVISKGRANADTGLNFCLYQQNTNKIRFAIYDKTFIPFIDSTTAPVNGTWYHIALVRDIVADEIQLWVDGVMESSTTDTTTGSITNDVPMTLGCARGVSGTNEGFSNVVLGDVKARSRAFGADEIRQDMFDVKQNYQGLFDGLVAGYDFKNDAKDFSGNGNDGTVNLVTQTTDNFGIANSAYNWTGTNNEWITVPDNASLSPTESITIVSFLNANSFATTMRAVNKNNTATSGDVYLLAFVGGKPFFRINGSPNVSDGTVLSTSTDYVVGGVYDKTDLRAYVDGVLDGTPTAYTSSITDSSGAFYIGNHNSGGTGTNPFNGKIYYTLVWNRALSADEMKLVNDLIRSGYIYHYINGGRK